MWRDWNHCTALVGMEDGAAAVESRLAVPQWLNIELPCDPAIPPSSMRPRGMETSVHTSTCRQMFIVALITVARRWNHHMFVSWWMQCIHHYLTIKRSNDSCHITNEPCKYDAKWKKLVTRGHIQGGSKVGLQLWAHESLFLYYYLLIMYYFLYEQLQAYFCPTLYCATSFLWSVRSRKAYGDGK